MRPEEFTKIRALENKHWWYRGRRRLLRRMLARTGLRDALVLDAGCGTGFAAEELRAAGVVVELDTASEAFVRGPGREPQAACVASIDHAPFQDNSFDLVTALDVLEHVENDSDALKELFRVCKPGGYLFVTVPAYPSLWSAHDEALGHLRRYRTADLREKVTGAGFEVFRASYFVSLPLPAAALYRCARKRASGGNVQSDLFSVPEPANFLLTALMKMEAWLAWSTGLPFGLTAFVLARKPAADGAGS